MQLMKSTDTATQPPSPKRRLRKSNPRNPDWAAGNAAKYFSYAEAWTRIRLATKAGYFLEAVTIEESIVSDRLLSLLQKTCGLSLPAGTTKNLGRLIDRWKLEYEARLADDHEWLTTSRALHQRLDAWRDRRNDVVHGLVKSTAGKNDDHIENFLAAAELSAVEGQAVARAISSWVESFKKRRPSAPVAQDGSTTAAASS